ncbi:hypothetical protein ACN0IJ_19700, partial [Shewanella indica]|uniref:hypothetical protein n=1 Tax=Shewanella indica TaxID=768528 RepID=UPI003D361AFA
MIVIRLVLFGGFPGIAGFIALSCRVQIPAPPPSSERPACANRRAFSYLSFDDCYSFGVVWGISGDCWVYSAVMQGSNF